MVYICETPSATVSYSDNMISNVKDVVDKTFDFVIVGEPQFVPIRV